MSNPIIEVSGLSKSYCEGESQLTVLADLDLVVSAGERVAIVGLSGSGKSTLLHLVGGLDQPDSGNVLIEGQSVFGLSEKAQCKLRNQSLGFVYQFHHLLSEFNAEENVAMPLLIRGLPKTEALIRARQLLEHVSMSARLTHRPAELSGGERQRVAIARALVGNPVCVLADEPTGNLDETSAAEVDALMVSLSAELGTSFVVVTHNSELASRLDRTLRLHNGKLES
ncbi:MAG: lipoprotein-releasing system ATP-binding protein [Candidatus Azotimanducaceae bacterium]|jgi:lipoprotein-releasing system ATP-binding protein